jgi:TRAP-type C4-dicarboxylate transport system substrate-binding protein
MTNHRATGTVKTLSTLAAAGLLLTACAGEAGNAGTDPEATGFEYGASQEEVNEVIADLEPVELTYQASAASPNSLMAAAAESYKDYIEERSNGQITLDVIYGQAIADYPEVYNALADGRLDLAYALPIYDPSDYPSFDAAATAMAGLPISPVAGEAIYNAVSMDIGWQNETLLQEYEAQGVTPLTPIVSSGGYYSVCAEEGVAFDDWNGRQIRVASTSHHGVVEAIGASPVSMEYVEVYEALQRGTVDCSFAQLIPSAEAGLLEVAPNIGYSSDDYSMSSRAVGAELAGSSFDSLPLAYQQIIFDASQARFAAGVPLVASGNAESVRQVKEANGTIEQFDSETEETIGETNQQQLDAVIENGILGDDIGERVQEAADKWSATAEELGIEDQGSIEDLDEWWNADDYDFEALAQRVFEDSALAHRPE